MFKWIRGRFWVIVSNTAYWIVEKDVKTWRIIQVMYTSCENKAWKKKKVKKNKKKKLSLRRDSSHYLRETGLMLYQLSSWQRSLITFWFRNMPICGKKRKVKWTINQLRPVESH